jgi:hypothetical protein
MKTALRRSKALAHCIALLLAVLPAACYGGVLNVWIFQPVDDQTNSVPLRLPIGAWNWDLFVASERGIGDGDYDWSWQNATIDWSSTDNSGSAASEPTLFETKGNWTVTATYDQHTSHGINVTVVCPDEATYAGDPICQVPTMQGADTNYVWGGTFYCTYTWVDQYGERLYAAGLWCKEDEPVREEGSDCNTLPPEWTQDPFQLDGTASVEDTITDAYSSQPNAPCEDTYSTTALLGATSGGPWSCPYPDVSTITVTVLGEETTVTTTLNGVTDPTCNYLF